VHEFTVRHTDLDRARKTSKNVSAHIDQTDVAANADTEATDMLGRALHVRLPCCFAHLLY
jgi:hypothetical protein